MTSTRSKYLIEMYIHVQCCCLFFCYCILKFLDDNKNFQYIEFLFIISSIYRFALFHSKLKITLPFYMMIWQLLRSLFVEYSLMHTCTKSSRTVSERLMRREKSIQHQFVYRFSNFRSTIYGTCEYFIILFAFRLFGQKFAFDNSHCLCRKIVYFIIFTFTLYLYIDNFYCKCRIQNSIELFVDSHLS